MSVPEEEPSVSRWSLFAPGKGRDGTKVSGHLVPLESLPRRSQG